VCNRSAHCEGIKCRQPHNLGTLLLLAAPTRSAHGRAGATCSVLHKRVRCNSDIDQFENTCQLRRSSRPPCTCQRRRYYPTDPRRDDSAPATSSDASGTLYRAAHDDSGNARETAAAADPTTAARSPTFTIYKVPLETARLRQDVVFRVGARLSKIKRKALEIASSAVDGNVLRFIRTFEQYIKEIRPDST
jgi:hypothetical protein